MLSFFTYYADGTHPILDILYDDPRYVQLSIDAFAKASAAGELIACDRAVIARSGMQDREPLLEVESHVVRIGDVAFVTNPFELYLVFGQVVKSRSAAKQTFLIGKCGSSGYVPTAKSEKVGGCSGGVNVGKLGHEGGYLFCDEVVDEISKLFK